MKLTEVKEKLNLKETTCYFDGEIEVTGGYTSDLLSNVIANAKKGNIWVTLQTHINITAVAELKELAAIIIVMNNVLDNDAKEKAEQEKINILKTDMDAFQITGKLYELGLR